MENKKPNTLQERMGFKDTDLLKQNHDEIMCWVDKNIIVVLEEALCINQKWDIDDVRFLYRNSPHAMSFIEKFAYPDNPKKLDKSIYDQLPKKDIVKKQDISIVWEFPIESGRNYIIGFADFKITYPVFYLYADKEDVIEIGKDRNEIFIEVKTEIKSLGEVLRQIKMYQNYVKDGEFMVISPDVDNFSEIFKSQNILTFKYSGC